MPEALEFLANSDAINWRSLETPLAEKMGLSAQEIEAEYESGNGAIFLDRVSWALSALGRAKLVERPKRGFYQITQLGLTYLDRKEKIYPLVKEVDAKKRSLNKEKKQSEVALTTHTSTTNHHEDENIKLIDTTPSEALDLAFDEILESRYELILDTILSKTPTEFEHLVVKLLGKMGYGDQISNSGFVTQASNDGGIDGVVKEDVLGFGRIHIQAKRYARENSISRESIQNFVGALAVAQSNKGVFITTSRFTKGASDYAKNLNGSTNLVLIDGLQLAKYIYDYSLGMQTERVIEIKELDADFWDRMKNEELE
ncbi:restriction endonuclease [Shewanella colwelliana]|uniref:restriction endonuclease n=1 Tax=Shewanella colwelliana TaxID=23 RepID=UPI0022AE94EC|nr:restriction endonuclease [Shewanella colwelliana]MCZ4339762.1 restriction endonuclease [Shewanella colwelliana]